jgi:hypothetical protein
MAMHGHRTITLDLLVQRLQSRQIFLQRKIIDLPGNYLQVIGDRAHIIEMDHGPGLGLLKKLEAGLFQFFDSIRELSVRPVLASRHAKQLIEIVEVARTINLLGDHNAAAFEHTIHF